MSVLQRCPLRGSQLQFQKVKLSILPFFFFFFRLIVRLIAAFERPTGKRNISMVTGVRDQKTKFYTARLRPEVQPLTLLYAFLDRKCMYPFRIPSIGKWYPFRIPSLQRCIPFNCCKCTVVKILINHKSRKFPRLFRTHKFFY